MFMKKTSKNFGWAVTIAALGAALAQAEPQPAPAPAAPAAIDLTAPPSTGTVASAIGPKIQFETPTYDFGKTKAGDPVKHTFIFTNTGDAALELTAVQPSCGCTAAGEWTKRVEPGKTGT